MTVIGVDIGGTKALAVRLEGDDRAATVRHEVDHRLSTIEALQQSIDRVKDESVTAIGVGVAGLVRVDDGLLVWGPHISGTSIPIKSELEQRYGVPVIVDNDANAAAIAEFRMGAGAGYRNGLLVTLGTGIGGAIVVDGDVFRGEGFAGEWGHVKVDDQGVLCDCGKRGCWETKASGPALSRLAREVVTSNPEGSLARALADTAITGESVVAAADAGEETARSLVAEVGRAFGQGIADLTAIFDPQIVVVGGGLGSVGESIIGPARRVVADSLHGGNLRVPPTVQVAALGEAAGAVGAAMMAREDSHG